MHHAHARDGDPQPSLGFTALEQIGALAALLVTSRLRGAALPDGSWLAQ